MGRTLLYSLLECHTTLLVELSIKSLFLSGTSEAISTAQILLAFLFFKLPPGFPIKFCLLCPRACSQLQTSYFPREPGRFSQGSPLVSIFRINYFLPYCNQTIDRNSFLEERSIFGPRDLIFFYWKRFT